MITSILVYVVAVVVAYFILHTLFHATIGGILINSIVGILILAILNKLGFVIPLNLVTAIVIGFFGIPGILVLIILKLAFKIF